MSTQLAVKRKITIYPVKIRICQYTFILSSLHYGRLQYNTIAQQMQGNIISIPNLQFQTEARRAWYKNIGKINREVWQLGKSNNRFQVKWGITWIKLVIYLFTSSNLFLIEKINMQHGRNKTKREVFSEIYLMKTISFVLTSGKSCSSKLWFRAGWRRSLNGYPICWSWL